MWRLLPQTARPWIVSWEISHELLGESQRVRIRHVGRQCEPRARSDCTHIVQQLLVLSRCCKQLRFPKGRFLQGVQIPLTRSTAVASNRSEGCITYEVEPLCRRSDETLHIYVRRVRRLPSALFVPKSLRDHIRTIAVEDNPRLTFVSDVIQWRKRGLIACLIDLQGARRAIDRRGRRLRPGSDVITAEFVGHCSFYVNTNGPPRQEVTYPPRGHECPTNRVACVVGEHLSIDRAA